KQHSSTTAAAAVVAAANAVPNKRGGGSSTAHSTQSLKAAMDKSRTKSQTPTVEQMRGARSSTNHPTTPNAVPPLRPPAQPTARRNTLSAAQLRYPVTPSSTVPHTPSTA